MTRLPFIRGTGPGARLRHALLPALLLLAGWIPSNAIQEPSPDPERESVLVPDPSRGAGRQGLRPGKMGLPPGRAAAWEALAAAPGGPWEIRLDSLTGSPLLIQGRGLAWGAPGAAADPAALEPEARAFLARHRGALGIDPRELVLDESASGPWGSDRGILVFRREIGGIPVEGERLRFYLVRGRMVALGTTGWGRGSPPPAPALDAAAARERVHGWTAPALPQAAGAAGSAEARLVLLPVPVEAARGGPGGVDYRLAWLLRFQASGDPARWVARVDAATGEVIGLEDETRYAHLKGGVFPRTNDGECPGGCQQEEFPMPHVDMVDALETNAVGRFGCVKNFPVGTRLTGLHTWLLDSCGQLDESSVCGEEFRLGSSGPSDCSVPPGGSPGNTAATRTIYYHLNRVQEKARYWLPGLSWHRNPLLAFANLPSVCNAFYNGAVGFFGSGGGCSNSGQLGAVVVHEYGHGLDEHDGGGFDNSTEAYADAVALLQTRRSCVGEGFFPGFVCGGFGDTCLACSGVREMDWEMRESGTPATPAGFILPNCPVGGGACGRSTHCESYVASGAIWDLATRDLPAMGLDPATAWQVTERLWYSSRTGSGGDIFNCHLPSSDGCSAGSWFTQLRVADDDDGNLANGTPHGAAIFAAFHRHAIACGLATDQANASTSGCPVLDAPDLQAEADQTSALLQWSPVAGAAGYRILRTEVGCDYSQNVVAETGAASTAFTDPGLPRDLAFHYRVQPLAANPACDGPVSICASAAVQPWAATIGLDRPVYTCEDEVAVTVYDGNLGASGALIRSQSEPLFEALDLDEEIPLSARHVGRIPTTAQPSAQGDGRLQVAHGGTITARYVDRDDGQGGRNVIREATAAVDCVAPEASGVRVEGITDTGAVIRWSTLEPASAAVLWDERPDLRQRAEAVGTASDHAVSLGGLRPCTRYYFRVESLDGAGNRAVTGDGGEPFIFETLGRFDGALRQCHQAAVRLDRAKVGCLDDLPLRLTDLDLNTDPDTVEHAEVRVASTTETLPERVTLRETGANTSVFTGSLPTGPGTPVAGDRRLQVAHGDVVTAALSDADDGTGRSAPAFTVGQADCLHEGFTSIVAAPVSDAEARIAWATAEPASGVLEWGPTPALGNVVERAGNAFGHAVEVEPLDECGRIWFRITSLDARGNKSLAGFGDEPLAFSGAAIPGVVFQDGFEKDLGWTLEGEWERGAPAGTGTAPDDPVSALFDGAVLGHDLSGQGRAPRMYESDTDESAVTPVLDASGLRNAELRFYRYLNSGGGARAVLETETPSGWVILWDAGERSASSWAPQVLDVSPWADGNPALRFRFRQIVPVTFDRRGGWNVDRFVLRDGSLPSFQACGGCGAAPSTDGLRSARDADACAFSGILLEWSPAPAWGTGTGGSYAVYRGEAPGFQPSPATLVAAGIAGTSWLDPSPPPGREVWYLVRAENDETCAAGPANGGVTDVNRVYLSAADRSGVTAGDDLGAGLLARDVAGAHVRLEWPGGTPGASYTVLTSARASGPFLPLATVATGLYESLGEAALPGARFYLVEPADPCGEPASIPLTIGTRP